MCSGVRLSLPRQLDRRGGVGICGFEGAAKDIVQIAQAIDRTVQYGDIGAHPGADLGGVGADNAATDHQNLGRQNAGNATQQNAATAIGLLQRPGPDLRGQASRNL